MWRNISAAPADSILGLTEAFKNDPNPNKVNLGVGVYKNEQGETPVLASIKEAEKHLLRSEKSKSYLPISGDPVYALEVQKLLFGDDSEVIENCRAITCHAPGGTGALRVGGELLKKFRPDARMWISKPTWANHKGVFSDSGFPLMEYVYYDEKTRQVDFDGMIASLANVSPSDVVLFHACCHNPSGVDLTPDQWEQIALLAEKKGWIPFLDFAYQGFGDSVSGDRAAVEAFTSKSVDFFVASSFSKNFALYNERTGALTICCPTSDEAGVALSHLKTTIRTLYSNPPAHGGLAVAKILSDQNLKKQWLLELAEMRERIKNMRLALVEGMQKRGVEKDFSYIAEQRGMFSFSGLSNEVVDWLRTNKAIYIVQGGRINVAGLTQDNIDYVCDSISEALQKC